jgi:hypothetical protein
MKPGDFYGGRPENIAPTWDKKPARATAKHFEVITEDDLAELFGHGEYELPRALAAKLLAEFTETHRTTAYRALRLNGRFGRHLHADGAMLSWR